ncbi:MAG: hypothetical protein ACYCTB_09760 [bacterium]
MTRQEQTFQRDLDFSQWIRNNLKDSFTGLITQDIDWIFVNYCTGYFIIVEVKTHSVSIKTTTPPQTVILKMVDEFFKKASEINMIESFSINPATKVNYKFVGTFLLSFSNTDPDNSEKIFLNNSVISKEDLKKLLNLDSDISLEIANNYSNNWINNTLATQIKSLTGNCD